MEIVQVLFFLWSNRAVETRKNHNLFSHENRRRYPSSCGGEEPSNDEDTEPCFDVHMGSYGAKYLNGSDKALKPQKMSCFRIYFYENVIYISDMGGEQGNLEGNRSQCRIFPKRGIPLNRLVAASVDIEAALV